jgi:hypothetical protein
MDHGIFFRYRPKIRHEIGEVYGQLHASADAGMQPPVQTGSPNAVMVADPYISAEQNACPNAVIRHFPGPHSILPSKVFTMPPKGGEQAISPVRVIRQVPPDGGQTTLP